MKYGQVLWLKLDAVALLGEKRYSTLADIVLMVPHVVITIVVVVGIGVVAMVVLTVVVKWRCLIV